MIRECKIILNNNLVTVVDFDGVEIQFPSINNDNVEKIYVKQMNNKYFVVDKKEYLKYLQLKKTKKTNIEKDNNKKK